jgi:putative transposase
MLPTTRSGAAKVQPGRGVKVNYLHYWSDAFRQPTVEGAVVPVKYDPFNAGIAYAYVNGAWERCLSERYATFQGRTEREIALATAALRQQKRLDRQQVNINAQTLAVFLASVAGQETVLGQQLKDRAVQHVHASLPDPAAEPPSISGRDTTEQQPASAAKPPVRWHDLELYGDLIL